MHSYIPIVYTTTEIVMCGAIYYGILLGMVGHWNR